MKPRKIPLRMCVGCREMKPKKELLRVVKSPAGEIALDRTGKMPGRGAYVCRDAQCLQKAVKTRQLERALEHPIGAAVFEALSASLIAEGAGPETAHHKGISEEVPTADV